MARIILLAFFAGVIEAVTLASAGASPACLRDHQPYQLNGDDIAWSMAIVPGADCLQGLRWSYMQVYAVWVLEKPVNGELVTVGSGFRYFAKPGFSGTDKFKLVVVGKNRHEEGYSTVEVTVSPKDGPPPAGAMSRIYPAARVADAAPAM